MGEVEDDAGPGMLGDEVMRELMKGFEQFRRNGIEADTATWAGKPIVSAGVLFGAGFLDQFLVAPDPFPSPDGETIYRNIVRMWDRMNQDQSRGRPAEYYLRSFGVRWGPETRAMAEMFDDIAGAMRARFDGLLSELRGTVDHVTTPALGELVSDGVPNVTINAAAGAVVNINSGGGAFEARLTAVEGRLMSLEESVDGIKASVVELKQDLAARLAAMQAQIDAAVAALAADQADVAAAQTALDALAVEVKGAVDLVGDADGDGTPAAPAVEPVVDGEGTPE